jgi:hypothetical protein
LADFVSKNMHSTHEWLRSFSSLQFTIPDSNRKKNILWKNIERFWKKKKKKKSIE